MYTVYQITVFIKILQSKKLWLLSSTITCCHNSISIQYLFIYLFITCIYYVNKSSLYLCKLVIRNKDIYIYISYLICTPIKITNILMKLEFYSKKKSNFFKINCDILSMMSTVTFCPVNFRHTFF